MESSTISTGLKRGKASIQELAFIAKNADNMTVSEIAHSLGRSTEFVIKYKHIDNPYMPEELRVDDNETEEERKRGRLGKREQALIDVLLKDGKTPEEIANEIKRSVHFVNNYIITSGESTDTMLGRTVNGLLCVGKSNYNFLWECVCGTVMSKSLRYVQSIKNHICNHKDDELSNLNQIFRQYQLGAAARAIEFNLLRDEVMHICSQACYYCGGYGHRIIGDAQVKLNGIDRINSEIGYFLDNVVSCCRQCNLMKRDMPQSAFIAHCASIYLHTRKDLTRTEDLTTMEGRLKALEEKFSKLERREEGI